MGVSNEKSGAGLPAPSVNAASSWGKAREVFRRLGAVSILGLISVTIPAIGGFTLLAYVNTVGNWLKSNQSNGPLIYSGGFALLSGLALLPTYAQAILGGWAFGFAVGYPAAMAGLLGGAIIAYFIARMASGRRVTDLIREYPRGRVVYDALVGSGFWRALLLVFLLRLPPSSPFAATNLLLAVTRVGPLAYTIGTVFGLAPRTALVVYWFSHLSKLDMSERLPWGFMILGAAISLAALAVLGLIANHALQQFTKAHALEPTPN